MVVKRKENAEKISIPPVGNISSVQDNDQTRLIDNINSKTPRLVYILAIFSAIGGFLFGYDTGVISGAMLLLKDEFDLSILWQETIVSATIGGAIIFALIGGLLNDIIGRKLTIIFASLIFTSGSLCLAFAMSKTTLVTGRFILGFGIGLASMSVPMYIAEMSPAELRGRLVTLNVVFVTGGQFVASVVDGLFSYDRKNGWRYMLGLAAIPSCVQLVAFLFLPESPRWCMIKGKEQQARSILNQLRNGSDLAERDFEEIGAAIRAEKNIPSRPNRPGSEPQSGGVLWQIFLNPATRRALMMGCALQVFQQLAGINTVMYYSATIIEMSGVGDKSKAIWLSAATSLVNFLCTFVGLYLVERIGRRTLTLASLSGVIVSLGILAIGFNLSALFSPPVTYHPAAFANNPCDAYKYCYSCVEDLSCGYCYVQQGAQSKTGPFNGSCLPTTRDNATQSYFGRCRNGIKSRNNPRDGPDNYYHVAKAAELRAGRPDELIDDDSNLVWAYNFCPTPYYWIPILGLFMYLFFFAPGMGPMPWTINSEIYPLWARSTGNSVAAASNWFTNLLVSMTFLTLTEKIGKHMTFWLYAGFSLLGFFIIYLYLPETKGQSLEDIQSLFQDHVPILGTPSLVDPKSRSDHHHHHLTPQEEDTDPHRGKETPFSSPLKFGVVIALFTGLRGSGSWFGWGRRNDELPLINPILGGEHGRGPGTPSCARPVKYLRIRGSINPPSSTESDSSS